MESIIAQRELTGEEIAKLAQVWLDPDAPDSHKESTLEALSKRGETAGELAGFAKVFLPLARNPGLTRLWNGKPLLDVCGTGGGGVNLFNVSTAMMFVLGAMEVPVVKHGNRGVTKKSGSADVLEALGIRLDVPEQGIEKQLREVGVAFLYAPKFHPAFATVASGRRNLGNRGVRTIFNLLGPLLNPAEPQARLVGVFSPQTLELYAEALEILGVGMYLVACGFHDLPLAEPLAIGEVSVTGATLYRAGGSSLAAGRIVRGELQKRVSDADLGPCLVANANQSAEMIENILRGQGTEMMTELVAINAAAGAFIQGRAETIEQGRDLAIRAIADGSAHAVLERWRAFSKK